MNSSWFSILEEELSVARWVVGSYLSRFSSRQLKSAILLTCVSLICLAMALHLSSMFLFRNKSDYLVS